MSDEQVRLEVHAAQEHLDKALEELGPAPVPASPILRDPLALDIALASAPAGAVFTLGSTLRYPQHLTLRKPVRLYGEATPDGRMTLDAPLPMLLGGLTIAGDDVMVSGVEVRHTNVYTDIVTLLRGARTTLDRCRVMGHPVLGAKRGIAANGNGECSIRQCWVDDCFYDGFESQAILAFDMAPGLLIEDNFLRAGGEVIMLGGVDVPLERIPSDVTIRGNTLTKKPAWMGARVTVKNALEIKGGRRVQIDHNVLEYSWQQAQGGHLIVLTVRNQDGKAPWTVIEDVVIEDNQCAHSCAAVNILGRDDRAGFPSGVLQRVMIRRNTFTDLDPKKWNRGSGQMIQIGGGPVDLTTTENTFAGVGLNASLFLYGSPKCERLTVTNNQWSRSTYGVIGDGAGTGKAGWDAFVASGTLSGNEITP